MVHALASCCALQLIDCLCTSVVWSSPLVQAPLTAVLQMRAWPACERP